MRRTTRSKNKIIDESSSDEDEPKKKLPKQATPKKINPISDSSSESDMEKYMMKPDEIDLNSELFKSEPAKSFDEIERKIFEGVDKLSNSESEEENADASTKKSEDETLMKSVREKEQTENEEIKPFSFTQFYEYTKKIEEAKTIVEKFNTKKKRNVKKKVETIDDLLAAGEKLTDGENQKINEALANGTVHLSDFESCSDSDGFEEVTEGEKPSIIPKNGVEITVSMPQVISKKKKGLDLVAALKRRLNRIRKENQVYVHKVHLLCWIGHGNYINNVLNSECVLAVALSILPSQQCYPPQRVDIKYLEQIVTWYSKNMKVKERICPKDMEFEQFLLKQMETKEVYNKKMFVYVFICILRALGLQCRLVLSLQPEPLKPPSSELHSLSTKINEDQSSKVVETDESVSKKVPTKVKKLIDVGKKGNTLEEREKDVRNQKTKSRISVNKDVKAVAKRKSKTSTSIEKKDDKMEVEKIPRTATKRKSTDKLEIKDRILEVTDEPRMMNKRKSADVDAPVDKLETNDVPRKVIKRKSTGKKEVKIEKLAVKDALSTAIKRKSTDKKEVDVKTAVVKGRNKTLSQEEKLESKGMNTDSKKKLLEKEKSGKAATSKISADKQVKKPGPKPKPKLSIEKLNLEEEKPTPKSRSERKIDAAIAILEKLERSEKIKETKRLNKLPMTPKNEIKSPGIVASLKDFEKWESDHPSLKLTPKSSTPLSRLVEGEVKLKKSTPNLKLASSDNQKKTKISFAKLKAQTKRIPQLDGTNDEPSTSKKTRLKVLCENNKTKKCQDDKFKNTCTVNLRRLRLPSPKSSSDANSSQYFNKTGVENDIVKLVKGRINEARSRERTRKKIVNDQSDDSDYAPEQQKIRKISKVKVKQRILPKKELERLEKDKKETKQAKKSEIKKGVDIWVEVFLEAEEKWISADVIKGQVHCIKELYSRASHPVSYIVSWDNTNRVKDLTKRYCPNWNTVTRKLRTEPKWWEESLKGFEGKKTFRDKEEDEDLARQQLDQPIPKVIGEFKNHPLYVLKRHLLKFEAIYPPNAVTLGFVRGEAVYSRDCVYTLHSREIWVKHAKVVKLGEEPYKIVKARPKYDRLTRTVITDQPLEIFGPWQIEDYVPPTAENGVVPRNAYGNVELFKDCMLPKKTIHLRLPGLNKVARKLNIDCAPAVVGFDFHSGGSHPMFDGYVVCEEFEEVLKAAWQQEQIEIDKREREKYEKRVYGNWRRLIKAAFIRERLKARYDFGEGSSSSNQLEKIEEPPKPKKIKGPRFIVNKKKK